MAFEWVLLHVGLESVVGEVFAVAMPLNVLQRYDVIVWYLVVAFEDSDVGGGTGQARELRFNVCFGCAVGAPRTRLVCCSVALS